MERKPILFDIDRTIFDPEKLLQGIDRKMMNVYKTEEGEIFEEYKEYRKELKNSIDFEPDEFIKRISKTTNQSFKEIHKIYYDSEIWKKAVYPETNEVLKKLKELEYPLGIYSEKFVYYQMAKLQLTGLINSFNPKWIFIGEEKSSDKFIKNLPQGATIVEDKFEIVEKLHKENRFDLIVWINRKNEKRNIKGIACLPNLRKLPNLLESKINNKEKLEEVV